MHATVGQFDEVSSVLQIRHYITHLVIVLNYGKCN